MYELDVNKHSVYLGILNKYKNNVLPQLPLLIISYLMENIEKAPLYLDKNIKVKDILKYIDNEAVNQGKIKILDKIIEYVEVQNA